MKTARLRGTHHKLQVECSALEEINTLDSKIIHQIPQQSATAAIASPKARKDAALASLLKACAKQKDLTTRQAPQGSETAAFTTPEARKDAALVSLLKACAKQKDLSRGSRFHAEALRKGSLKAHHYLGSILVSMYANCGALAKARWVFDEIPVRDVVSWTALITGYARHGHGDEALQCFELMQGEGLFPNAITFACILKVCANTGAAEKGKSLHVEIMRKGLLRDDVALGNALMDMYFKSGTLSRAMEVFNELPFRDMISWNAAIAGYAQNGHGEEALDCFEQMQQEGLLPDATTMLHVLPACGNLGAAEKGGKVHADIIKNAYLERGPVLGTALVDMYAKCGALSKAEKVFDELLVRDVVSWNSLMAGYAEAGKHGVVFDSFETMVGEGTQPTVVTFVILLNVCSSLGLVEEGKSYFQTMTSRYGIDPTLEHHTCMVELYGHAGHLKEALDVIERMPSLDYRPTWFALLGACRKWANVAVGRFAFTHAVRLEKSSAVVYVYMRDIYAAAGMQEDADKIEAMRYQNEAWL